LPPKVFLPQLNVRFGLGKCCRSVARSMIGKGWVAEAAVLARLEGQSARLEATLTLRLCW
jgi:hypothetical protein